MSARSGLVGKNPPGPIWGHMGPIFPWTGKMQKIVKFCIFLAVAVKGEALKLPMSVLSYKLLEVKRKP